MKREVEVRTEEEDNEMYLSRSWIGYTHTHCRIYTLYTTTRFYIYINHQLSNGIGTPECCPISLKRQAVRKNDAQYRESPKMITALVVGIIYYLPFEFMGATLEEGTLASSGTLQGNS
jgi:hypothetical protein